MSNDVQTSVAGKLQNGALKKKSKKWCFGTWNNHVSVKKILTKHILDLDEIGSSSCWCTTVEVRDLSSRLEGCDLVMTDEDETHVLIW